MADEREPATLGALFIAFLTVSLFGFGGGIVWAHRIAVEQRRWVGEEEFADILSLCQFMPGPNIIGIAVCIGAHVRGAAGAFAAAAGFLLVPWVVGFSIGVAFLRYAGLAEIRNVLAGVSAAAAGLLIATGLRMLRRQRRRPWALAIAALAFVGIVFTRLPLPIVLSGATLIGVAVTRTDRIPIR